MLYVAIYLYVLGSTLMWWFARSRPAPMAGKILAAVLWPVTVPVVALWW